MVFRLITILAVIYAPASSWVRIYCRRQQDAIPFSIEVPSAWAPETHGNHYATPSDVISPFAEPHWPVSIVIGKGSSLSLLLLKNPDAINESVYGFSDSRVHTPYWIIRRSNKAVGSMRLLSLKRLKINEIVGKYAPTDKLALSFEFVKTGKPIRPDEIRWLKKMLLSTQAIDSDSNPAH